MKIENLKSTGYTRGAHTLRITVQAINQLAVQSALVGKDELRVVTDNETVEKEVEVLSGFKYLKSVTNIGENLFEAVLTDIEPTPQSVEEEVIANILEYGESKNVDQFTVGNVTTWLNKSDRTGLELRFKAEMAKGRTETTLWLEGRSFTFPLTGEGSAPELLILLELYASECFDNTQRHIAAVKALSTIEEKMDYDYTTGYPDKLVF